MCHVKNVCMILELLHKLVKVMETNLTEYCLKISTVVDQIYKHKYTLSGFYGRSWKLLKKSWNMKEIKAI